MPMQPGEAGCFVNNSGVGVSYSLYILALSDTSQCRVAGGEVAVSDSFVVVDDADRCSEGSAEGGVRDVD